MLDFVFENHTSDKTWNEEFFRKAIMAALQALDLSDKKVEVGLQLISPERSRELNNRHRHIDKPTDVLSFPLNERGLTKEYGILPLGDIFICLEVASRQAEELNIPLSQDLARLTVHGVLHLCGYDHEQSPQDEKTMIDLQEKILRTIDIND